MSSLFTPASGTGTRCQIRLCPRAAKEKIGGWHGQALKVWVTAPPVDNRANEALVALLAKTLGIGRKDITLVAGWTSRNKLVEIRGLTPEEVAHGLGVDMLK